MINHMRGTQTKVTDFQPGSVARTVIEGPAVEIEELYLQMFTGLREAIPVAVFQSFGFDKLPPTYAFGFASVSRPAPVAEDMPIPAGTVFTAPGGRSYHSTSDVTWLAAATMVTIPIISDQPGTAGNAGAGVINASPLFGTGYTVSNQPITNGSDDESDEAREARFSEFVQSLSRGTEVACRYAARQATVRDSAGNILERVTRDGFTEIAGYFKIYLYSSQGVPSPDLIAEGQALIDGRRDPLTGRPVVAGFRAAGIRCDVLPMQEREIPMGIGVRMRAGYAVTAAVRQSITDAYSAAIRNIGNGDTLLIDNLRALLLGTPNVTEITLSSTQNITCGQDEALVPGLVTIAAL